MRILKNVKVDFSKNNIFYLDLEKEIEDGCIRKLHLAPNGIDATFFQQKGVAVLYVTRNNSVEHIEYVWESFEEIPDSVWEDFETTYAEREHLSSVPEPHERQSIAQRKQ